MDDDLKNEEVMKILRDSKIDIDSIFDEKARAEYLQAVAKIYDASVREKALKEAAINRENENRFREQELKNEKHKIDSETASKIVDATLRFIGDAGKVGVGVFSVLAFLKCWNEGMLFEQTGVFSSSTFKGLRNNIKLPKIW